MPLVKLDKLQLHYGEQVIFDDVSLQLNPGDKFCVVGRNGVGKSTLLKVIEGSSEFDDGTRFTEQGLRIANLSQELPEARDISVQDYVITGLGRLAQDLNDFSSLSASGNAADLDQLNELQQQIERLDGWNWEARVAQTLTRLELHANTKLTKLSGGWRRRVALAQALVSQPDVLLLDEPTNHLDVAAIEWLEEQLQKFGGAVLFITHDRAFLRRLANRIGELDRGSLFIHNGSYDRFLVHREERLATEEKHNQLFDKRLAREEAWIRQGIKARRTRNEGRVRALKKMRDERAGRRDQLQTARIQHGQETLSGKLVAELSQVSFSWEDQPRLIDHFTTNIVRGDKIGFIGPNGMGKTTLLKLILGELEPSQGSIKRGTKLSIAYFDQMRDQLEMDKSAMDNISEGREFIEIAGKSRHVISYLEDFLFTGERARTVIRTLSGGERNRILLAKLFSKPSNVLVLDEPTNDLDMETLELLENLLVEYSGTILLVSHDREFLDNVVTDSIAFEGDGKLQRYVGGYTDWIRQGGVWPVITDDKSKDLLTEPSRIIENKNTAKEERSESKKLSYKLQRELDELPGKIELMEESIAKLEQTASSPDFYTRDQLEIKDKLSELADQQRELEQLYSRWEELAG